MSANGNSCTLIISSIESIIGQPELLISASNSGGQTERNPRGLFEPQFPDWCKAELVIILFSTSNDACISISTTPH